MIGYKEFLGESLSADDMGDAIDSAMGSSDKFDQALWDWFEKNMDDSGIYAGDAVPEDYLEAMSDKQMKACYKAMSKKFKDVLDLNESDLTESKK